MNVRFQTVRLTKRYPLQISRGTSTGSNNLFVFVSDGSIEGVGECAPGTGFDDTLAAMAERQVRDLHAQGLLNPHPTVTWQAMHELGIDSSAMAAVDVALWDLLGKRAGLALHELFGLPMPTVPTSVTIGINPVEVVRERVPEILERTRAKFLKVKLGNPVGTEADKESFLAAKSASRPFGVGLRIDANGGWNPSDAKSMVRWLADNGCDYVEQPLAAGEENDLHTVYENSPIPIYLDESIKSSQDVARFADRCHGVNLKLMKTGGLSEALRLVATARAHGLSTMIGCMGESSVAIAAGASIGALFDHIDLDSHLNLNPDPGNGASLNNGVVVPNGRPGHGAGLKAETS